MAIRRAAVFANMKKGIARKVMAEVVAFLKKSGVQLSAKPQLVVTVGGDGTVLYNKSHYGVPYFAIGSASSFICQADFADWKALLAKAIAGKGADRRLLLCCKVDGRWLPPALNEIGIRNPKPRVLSMHLEAGKAHHAFRADGILFSTPTGSPAYCYSCGGAEMPSGSREYQVVAISPFRRMFRPAFLGEREKCVLRISGSERARLFIDGQDMGPFASKNTLAVFASKKDFLFAKV